MFPEKAILYAEENSGRFLQELKELVAIPSVSSDSNHLGDMKVCADFVEGAISSIGFDRVQMVETKKHPIVYGEWLGAPGATTVLLYGHYDVQPVDPLELWETPPFEASERDGRLYGRGTVDDKGQFYLHLKAMESWMRSAGSLPVNMKVIIEGEEEVGSESLEPFLDENREMLAADVAVISDTSMIKKGWPSITYGLRGIAYFQIGLKGPSQDLHSGIFGGAVKNPIHALIEIIGQLKDKNGRIAIPGVYDDVVELTSEERRVMAELPFEEELFLDEVGAPKLSWEDGYTPLESLWCRPALDVNGIWGGFSGEGSKTVIPSEAHAKVSIRLVPNQEPDIVGNLLETYVQEIVPPEVEVTIQRMHGGRPFLGDLSNPAFSAAGRALEKGFGAKAVYIREGGSIPFVRNMTETLDLPCLLLGFGLPGENAHAPNEWIDLENYALGTQSAIHLYHELSLM
ncbi:MAG: peptidase M20 [Candidatus Marinimicrobia bacterium]|nr:peptidase M20 [Candidatus Neomarinimicrobiota bacterium]|tara:strand:+ start:8738 stop:10111 length:1374 start_codon:yes stop_codon:yes gene_type:complete